MSLRERIAPPVVPKTGSVDMALCAMSRLYSPAYRSRSRDDDPAIFFGSHGLSLKARSMVRLVDVVSNMERMFGMDRSWKLYFSNTENTISPDDVHAGSNADVVN